MHCYQREPASLKIFFRKKSGGGVTVAAVSAVVGRAERSWQEEAAGQLVAPRQQVGLTGGLQEAGTALKRTVRAAGGPDKGLVVFRVGVYFW